MRNIKIFGLIILLLVLVIPQVSTAAFQFCNPNTGGGDFVRVPCPVGASGPAGSRTFGNIIVLILDVALFIVGSISVLFLIIGGFRYVTAHGNEEQAESAKKTITSAIIGLVVVVLSFAIVTIIVNVLVTGVP